MSTLKLSFPFTYKHPANDIWHLAAANSLTAIAAFVKRNDYDAVVYDTVGKELQVYTEGVLV